MQQDMRGPGFGDNRNGYTDSITDVGSIEEGPKEAAHCGMMYTGVEKEVRNLTDKHRRGCNNRAGVASEATLLEKGTWGIRYSTVQ
jgi:hypothetical protein